MSSSEPAAVPGKARKATRSPRSGPRGPRAPAEVLVGIEAPAGHLFAQITGPIEAGSYNVADLELDLARLDQPVIVLHSPGGDAPQGAAIADRLDQAGATVHTVTACSAAVIVAASGKRRIIAANGWLGLHPVWTVTAGGHEEMSAAAIYLQHLGTLIAEGLAKRTKQPAEYWMEAMRQCRVFDPHEAIGAGLADEIGPPDPRATEKPERIDDSTRAVQVLRSRAANEHERAAYERSRRIRKTVAESQPETSAMREAYLSMVMVTAFTPPAILAEACDRAALHHLHDPEPWTGRWRCSHCGTTNFTAPARRLLPAACIHCKTTNEVNDHE